MSRARRIIENTFGILAAKFRVFRRLIAGADKVTKITMAACVLHNYLKITDMRNPASSSRLYCPPGYVDHEDPLSHLIQGDWRSEVGPSAGLNNVSRMGSNTFSRSAATVRDTFMDFFVSPEGEIEGGKSEFGCGGNYRDRGQKPPLLVVLPDLFKWLGHTTAEVSASCNTVHYSG